MPHAADEPPPPLPPEIEVATAHLSSAATVQPPLPPEPSGAAEALPAQSARGAVQFNMGLPAKKQVV